MIRGATSHDKQVSPLVAAEIIGIPLEALIHKMISGEIKYNKIKHCYSIWQSEIDKHTTKRLLK